MTALAITTLGEPEIRCDGVPCIFGTRKAFALTLYLAVTDQPHPRAQLIALFWPEADEEHGSTNLRQTLGRIRQAFGAEADTHLHTSGTLVHLDVGSEGTLDLAMVQAAVPTQIASVLRLTALSLFHGRFLSGFTLDDAPDFMAWVVAQQAHWEACYDLLAEREVPLLIANGQLMEAIALGQAWVQLRPDAESAYRLLATAQATAGDGTAARLTLATCAQRWAELGLELAPQTLHLQAQLLTLLPIPHEGAPVTASTIRLSFVGRHEDFDRLRQAYEDAQRGSLTVVMISGEAGVGKSRLLAAFAHWATLRGAEVVAGQAYEMSGRFPYQPLGELVRQRLAQEHAPEDLLDDLWLTELSRLVPELRERYPDLPLSVEDEGAGARLVEALAQFGLALARCHPLVWVLEDLHWADGATRDGLTALLGRWRGEGVPIMLVVTLRTEEHATSAGLQHWVTTAQRIAPLQTITLASLSSVHSAQTIQTLLGGTASEALCAWLFATTGGNPLYLEQVIYALVDRGAVTWQAGTLRCSANLDVNGLTQWLPPTLAQLLLQRVRDLDPTTQGVLAAAAIIGGRFSEKLVQPIASVEEEAVLLALEVAERRQLLQIDEGAYRFTHDRVAEAIYADLSLARRRTLHRRALLTLQRSLTAAPAECFRHALGAEEWESVLQYGRQAAEEAEQVAAYRDALVFTEQVYQVFTTAPHPTLFTDAIRWEIQQSLVYRYQTLGEPKEARAVCERFLIDARATGDQRRESRLLGMIGAIELEDAHDPVRAMGYFTEALHISEQVGAVKGQLHANYYLIKAAQALDDLTSAQSYAQQGILLARTTNHSQRLAVLLNQCSTIAAEHGNWEEACAALEESVLLFAQLTDDTDKQVELTYPVEQPYTWSTFAPRVASLLVASPTAASNSARQWGSDSLAGMGTAWLHLGEGETGRAALSLAWQIFQERHAQFQQNEHLLPKIFGDIEAGLYVNARQQAHDGIAALKASQFRSFWSTYPMPTCALVDAHHALFELHEAQPTLEEATTLAVDKPRWYRLLPATRWCTHYALQHDWGAAYQATILAQEIRDALPSPLTWFDFARYYETEALLRAGDHDQAQADADRLAASLGTNRRYRLLWLRMQALLDHDQGDHTAALAHLREALTLAIAMGLPGEQWQIEATLAETLATQGEIEPAHVALAQATAAIAGIAAPWTDASLREQFVRQAQSRLPTL